MFRNKYLFIVIIIVVLAAGFFMFNNTQDNILQQPKISISEEEWDFGKIKEDEKSEHIFLITNKGGEELIISRVRASCGCTATMLSSDHILPGESSELKTTFNPSGFEGITKKSIYIESNDPELPRAKVVIMADIETIPAPKVNISNSQWDFGLISQNDLPEFTFTIENKGELELIIEKMDASEYIQSNLVTPLTIPSNEKREIVFIYDSSEHVIGEVKESIRIYCNDPRKKAFSLRISGYIKEQNAPSISISPIDIDVNLQNDLDEELIGNYTMENFGEKSVKVVSIKTSVDYIIPLRSEFEIASNTKENLQLVIEKDKVRDKTQQKKTEEYLYLTIALPIEINNQGEK